MRHVTLPALLLPLTLATLSAQSLVGNLVTNAGGNPWSGIDEFAVLGNRAVFAANSQFGYEPWGTDGTPAGTFMLADLMPAGSSNPLDLRVLGGFVVFTADVPGYGRELWRTDGTSAGTVLLKDTRPGAVAGNPRYFVELGGYLYFAANDGVAGEELWRSDGTTAGTVMVFDVRTGNGSSSPHQLTAVGNRLFFGANNGNDGNEPWVYDPTTGVANLVADLTPGGGGTSLQEFAAFGNRLLFRASLGNGSEPWVSDGTSAGTFELADIQPGTAGSLPTSFTAVGGLAVFSADGPGVGRELYVTDGTVAGTTLLRDIKPGTVNSDPDLFTPVQGVLVFTATGPNGREPWRTDGTVAGTYELGDLFAGTGGSFPAAFAPVNGELWFGATGTGVGDEMFHTDGTVAGTGLVGDLVPGITGSSPEIIAAFGNQVLFTGLFGNAGVEPSITDGTAVGTQLLADTNAPIADSTPELFSELGTRVWFAAGTNSQGNETWATDGTPTGTVQLGDLNPGAGGINVAYRAERAGDVFFDGLVPGGNQLFLVDGVTQTSTQLTSAIPAVAPRGLCTLGNKVVFSGMSATDGRELWVSDGTPAGTFELLDIRPGISDSFPLLSENFTTVGAQTFFAANDGTNGSELWVTDGTTAGTHLVLDLNPGSQGSNPHEMVAVGNRLFFAAGHPNYGVELWATDGTAANTQVLDLWPGVLSTWPHFITPGSNGEVYFSATHSNQKHLYVSYGPGTGALLLRSGDPSQLEPFTDLTWTNAGLFFLFDDLSGMGKELWRTDGTFAGTQLVADVYPGQGSGPVSGTLVSMLGGSQLLFGATEPTRGLQLWASDGTAANTVRVSNYGTGNHGAVAFGEFRAIGARVFYACDDAISGREPWVFDPVNGSLAFVLPYGHGCAGSNGTPEFGPSIGLPTVGNAAFAVTLTHAMPFTVAVEVAAEGSTDIPLGVCHLLLGGPLLFGPLVLVDAAGFGTAPLPIPNDPLLVGYNLFLQWAVVDPLGDLFDTLAVSNGLQMQVGY